MSLSYTLRESMSGFRRTKLSSVLSIITISVALLLLGLFGVLSIHATRFLNELRARVELEVFLEEPISRHGYRQSAERRRDDGRRRISHVYLQG